MYKLLVFGNGGLWSAIRENIDFNKANVVAFINSDPNQRGKSFEQVQIIAPDEINNYNYDFIVLASGNYDALNAQLRPLGIPEKKIIAFKLNESESFKELQESVNNKFGELGNHSSFHLFSKRPIDTFHLCNMNLIGRDRKINVSDTNLDYVRLSSLELIADEIYSNNVSGNVAELGVYKGEFAKHISNAFPDRNLYLFDTFEGFDSRDVQLDLKNNFSIETTQFTDTNVDLVLNKMNCPENIIVRKGYFPETASGLEDQFAFVSIDTDLYKPIYDGLSYFYPRLAKGGYIFVHDYNNAIYKGSKEAVRTFCSENGIPFVPISDNLGTVVLAK